MHFRLPATSRVLAHLASVHRMELLERSAQLALLDEQLATVRGSGRGRLVLVAGEAGASKTALLHALYERHPRVPVLEGSCEPLFTPRPLGPFLDIAAELGGELAALVEREPSAAELLGVLSRELDRPRLVVLEDLHWADEATLDVIRLLGRRVARLPALVIATYRDDELDRLHRLRVVLGELSGPAVDRLRVEPLSPAAVHELAAGRGIDDERLYERTGGNALFVTEVLAAEGVADAPATVRDAVLARASRLSERGRRLLEAVAVMPPRAELWLLEHVAQPDLAELESCLASGMLRVDGNGIAFRHEIARVTIEAELPPDRRVALHRAALAALAGRADPARLAHHAEAAHDGEAVLEHATAAGERAARLGAHREAVAHFASALRHARALGPAERAALLERLAFECYLTSSMAEATDAYERARAAYRATGDRRREGDVERWLSFLAWSVGDRDAAEDHALTAVRLLEALPEGRELAMAYSHVALLRMMGHDSEAAIEWGERALMLAERLGEPELLVHALNNMGSAELRSGRRRGSEKLKRSLALALDTGLEDHAARAYVNLSWSYLHTRDFAGADPYLDAGIVYTREHDLEFYRLFASGLKARSQLDQSRWDAAAELAVSVVEHPRTNVLARIVLLTVIGLLRARRGDPDPWGPLDEALEIARSTDELQRLATVAAARAEARWLTGSSQRIAEETTALLELAIARGDAWTAGELYLWRRRGGLDDEVTATLAAPYAAELGDDARGAAGMWRERGCPYEAALAPRWQRRRDGHAREPGRAAGTRRAHGGGARRPSPARARCTRRPPRATPRYALEPGRPDDPAAGGPRTDRPGRGQRGDRGPTLPIDQDGRPPRLGDPAQTRRPHTRPGSGRSDPPGHHREIATPGGPQDRETSRFPARTAAIRSADVNRKGGRDEHHRAGFRVEGASPGNVGAG